jgi:hypothetical protein
LHSGTENINVKDKQGFIALNLRVEFKYLSHRQTKKNPLIERLAGFLHSGTENINVKDKQGFIALNLRVEFKYLSHRQIKKNPYSHIC